MWLPPVFILESNVPLQSALLTLEFNLVFITVRSLMANGVWQGDHSYSRVSQSSTTTRHPKLSGHMGPVVFRKLINDNLRLKVNRGLYLAC